MYDDLSRIESTYGSVAEFNRCRFEEDSRSFERELERQDSYAENRKLLKNNALSAIYHYGECFQCDNYTDVGCTDAEDDFPHGICKNHTDCPIWDKYSC